MNRIILLVSFILLVIFFIYSVGAKTAIVKNASAEGRSGSLKTSGSEPEKLTERGTIKGKVTYAGTIPERKKIEITKDVNICGKVPHYHEDLLVSSEDRGLANVVVGLSEAQGGKSLESWGTEFELDQNGCRFVPHVLLLPVGAKLKIKNSDGILHNIHTHGEQNRPINKAQPRFLKVISVSFDKPEIIRVVCDVHNWMNGYILVMDHPYYAVTDTNGNFELAGVPGGSYTLKYWHETLGNETQAVTVKKGVTEKVSFQFKKSKPSSQKN